MPKMRTELTPERDDEIARRSLSARAKLPPPADTETTHGTEARAKAKAARCAMPNTEVGAVETTHGWVGVVYLRPDQGWMAATVKGQGCRPMGRNV